MGALDCAPGGEVPFNVVAFCHANTLSGRKSGKLSLSKVATTSPKSRFLQPKSNFILGSGRSAKFWEPLLLPGALCSQVFKGRAYTLPGGPPLVSPLVVELGAGGGGGGRSKGPMVGLGSRLRECSKIPVIPSCRFQNL